MNNGKCAKSYNLHIPSEYRSFFSDLARDCADEEQCSMSEIVTRTFIDSVLPRDKVLRGYALVPYNGGSVLGCVLDWLSRCWVGQSAYLGDVVLDFADRYFPLTSWICTGRCNEAVLADGRLVKENLLQLLALCELSDRDNINCRRELLPLLNGPVSPEGADKVFSWLHSNYRRIPRKAQLLACGIAAMILGGVCAFLVPSPFDYEESTDRLDWCRLLRNAENREDERR